MNIEIDFRVENFVAGIQLARKRQIPYAVSVALNTVAFRASAELKSTASRLYTIRKRHLYNQIQVEKSTKRTLTALVGVTAPYAGLQTLGGVKRGQLPGLGRAVPGKLLRKTAGTVIPPRLFPLRLVADPRRRASTRPGGQPKAGGRAPKPFAEKARRGGRIILKRLKPGRSGLGVLWYIAPRVVIPPTFPLFATLSSVAASEGADAMAVGISRALRTARR